MNGVSSAAALLAFCLLPCRFPSQYLVSGPVGSGLGNLNFRGNFLHSEEGFFSICLFFLRFAGAFRLSYLPTVPVISGLANQDFRANLYHGEWHFSTSNFSANQFGTTCRWSSPPLPVARAPTHVIFAVCLWWQRSTTAPATSSTCSPTTSSATRTTCAS